MRSFLCVAVVAFLALAWACSAQADDQKETLAVVDKAVKALGGAEKLAKFKAQTWSEKGTYYGMGDGIPYTGKYAVAWPGQFRMEIEGVFIIVLDGDKGWMQMNGETREMSKEELAEQQEVRYAGWVATLTPLKDKSFTVAPLDEIKVAGREACGIKVSSKGHRDVSLFFDKETGLLVKSAFRAKASEQGGKEVDQEGFYSDYQEVDGIKIPMKINIKRDGKQYVEAELSDVKPVGKLDKSVFAKP